MARRASESFDEHERPTTRKARPASDAKTTTRMEKLDLEGLVQKESGTRAVVTPEQIDRYMRDRTALAACETETPALDALRERETLDAMTVQRETLVIRADVQSTAQQIPIDIDLSRLAPSPRPAAGRPPPLLARVDRTRLMIAVAFFLAMVSALLGFIAGRASF